MIVLLLAATIVLSACSGNANQPTASQPTAIQPKASQSETDVVGTVWVADEEGNSITVIDAATNQVLTTPTGIEGAHNLQVAPDGKTVWTVSGHDSLAIMIDAVTYEVHGVVPTGMMPAHIVLTPDGKKRMSPMVKIIRSP